MPACLWTCWHSAAVSPAPPGLHLTRLRCGQAPTMPHRAATGATLYCLARDVDAATSGGLSVIFLRRRFVPVFISKRHHPLPTRSWRRACRGGDHFAVDCCRLRIGCRWTSIDPNNHCGCSITRQRCAITDVGIAISLPAPGAGITSRTIICLARSGIYLHFLALAASISQRLLLSVAHLFFSPCLPTCAPYTPATAPACRALNMDLVAQALILAYLSDVRHDAQ